jgi:hypothetical protein
MSRYKQTSTTRELRRNCFQRSLLKSLKEKLDAGQLMNILSCILVESMKLMLNMPTFKELFL